ncbi:L-asparagine oxygenase [Kribbella antibiotica]|uniref:L-asparagine oxygenase n=1 Tax=Kribbella antibiotica TaxID=190195 RepID=A0A4R4ZSP5_9ACTN|nr:TauD/TfdA family dioxygenase [Kribbella antibiotica]TDD61276.1 L-asparagine oxygenase [Kribbella antibiotica]
MADSVLELPDDAAAEVARVAGLLWAESGLVDDVAWIAAARAAWEDLPGLVRRQIREFRRDSGPGGALVLRGLPVGDQLPETPSTSDSVQRETSVPAAVLAMIACGLGDPVAYAREKHGALVQDVVPVAGKEEVQGNVGSVDLTMHNENAFHDHRPDFVMLLCLRPDHDQIACLRVASIREALPRLSSQARAVLAHPVFRTEQPSSFGTATGAAEAHAVLVGAGDDPDLRVDFEATTASDPEAKQALRELSSALDAASRNVRLLAGDLAIVDNRIAVHGRTSFRPRYDGRDRWLQRTFAVADLRRSRGLRRADGYVLAD